MANSVYTTPLISPLLRLIARLLLKLMGWRIETGIPDIHKYVAVGAPHTSNWDYVIFLCAMLVLRMDVSVMVKDELYVSPFRALMRWAGVIPVNRRERNTQSAQMVKLFNERERMILMITPEGTRKRVAGWKTGFYHIAMGAKVPVVLGYLDYRRKAAGFFGVFWPSGNIAEDFAEWQSFYRDVTAKKPDLQMPIGAGHTAGNPRTG